MKGTAPASAVAASRGGGSGRAFPRFSAAARVRSRSTIPPFDSQPRPSCSAPCSMDSQPSFSRVAASRARRSPAAVSCIGWGSRYGSRRPDPQLTTTESSGSFSVERRRGGSYRLTSIFVLPQPIDLLFSFFSDAHDLEKLTPPWLEFRVLTPAPIPIERGTTIDYLLRIHGFRIRWTSEINVWEPPHLFTDRQLRGPYRRWEHEHTFNENDDGTLIGDRVEFEVPGGRIPGRLASADVRRIFAYRRARLSELCG